MRYLLYGLFAIVVLAGCGAYYVSGWSELSGSTWLSSRLTGGAAAIFVVLYVIGGVVNLMAGAGSDRPEKRDRSPPRS